MIGREVERTSGIRHARALRLGVIFVGAVLLVPSVTNCGGQSSRREGEGDGGSAGRGGSSGEAGVSTTGGVSSGGVSVGGEAGVSTTGGVSSGGVTSGGVSSGGSAGTGPDPGTACTQPVALGSCRGYVPSYWFDAATGICMPFIYGGCEGNDNRFSTMEECYAACGGRGVRDDAACSNSSECRTERLGEPCCSTELREFVGVGRGRQFSCDDPMFGCSPCAAGCADQPEDGYIGTSCVDGHCIPYDARTLGALDCNVTEDCYLVYGVGCCEDCEFLYPSKLVALSREFDFTSLSCGEGRGCAVFEGCEPPLDLGADCIGGSCEIVSSGDPETR